LAVLTNSSEHFLPFLSDKNANIITYMQKTFNARSNLFGEPTEKLFCYSDRKNSGFYKKTLFLVNKARLSDALVV